MSNSQGRSVKLKTYNDNEGYKNEQLKRLLSSRKGYIAAITKRINVINQLLNDINCKDITLSENNKLDSTMNHIRQITSELKDMYKDEQNINKALDICTEQEFRIISIRKSINSFLEEYFPNEDVVSLYSQPKSQRSFSNKSNNSPVIESPGQNSKPINKPEKGRLSSQSEPSIKSESSVKSKQSYGTRDKSVKSKSSSNSKDSYSSTKERRRTTDFMNLSVSDLEENAKENLELLKRSFEIEKNKIQQDLQNSKLKLFTSKLKETSDDLSFQSRSSKHSEISYEFTESIQDTNSSKQLKHNYNNDTFSIDSYKKHTEEKIIHKEISAKNKRKVGKRESIDEFIDKLIEGEETIITTSINVLNAQDVLRQEFESKDLPPVELRRFDGNPAHWPEFIESFKTRVHFKSSFTDNIRMERLISSLDGEAKKSTESIGANGIFYATALKTL